MMKETMTSRQRVKNAIEHKPVDRMPIDLSVHFSTGISAYAYFHLREFLGLSTDHIEMIDMMQGLARVDDDIIERFHVDTMLLNPPWQKHKRWNPHSVYNFLIPDSAELTQLPDGAWESNAPEGKATMPAGGYFFDGVWPNHYRLDPEPLFDYYAVSAERIHKQTDKFTMMMGFSSYFGGLDFACSMLTDPEEATEYNKQIHQWNIDRFDLLMKKMPGWVDSIEVNGDLGTQNGLMCTPDSYEQICYPFLKEFCDYVHKNSDIKVFMHSCGAIKEALPMIVDAGVDAINPVQISATGMDPAALKAQFGKDITFWGGGCETQTALWSYTPDQIRAHVKELVTIFKPGGGFVFNQVHNIMGNVPPENIIAMFDTAYENAWVE